MLCLLPHIAIAAIMLNNTFTMQSNDDGDKADADHVTAGEVHDSYPPGKRVSIGFFRVLTELPMLTAELFIFHPNLSSSQNVR